ncbi:DUF1302 domain-containing protein [Shewanella psychrotolerans]|uniref:DUF1302 domain-containing protein n=1 Tax=Shewanella psychrotolerans TaxID=2864206 RepID=UPI001C65866C|nr:DUF1302 domain-containing protein [Shewanella psychrotolerans]QYK03017.1 DUF1302 domain-containing protein [Shewanella psychrotolerans]
MKNLKKGFNKSTLALGIVAALSIGTATTATAVSFDWGEVQGSFDSTWSAGASWRVEERNWDDNIGKVNHPRFDWSNYSAFNNTKYTSAEIWAQPGSYSSNGDLSNMLYSQGDVTSMVFKGLHELSLKYKNYGLFARGMYFYDQKANNGSYGYSDPITGKEYDPCTDSEASKVQCKDVRLLDAFIYGDFDFNDGANPLTVRVGNQVVSWGESTLIPHGIGVINPVDLNILNAPGAELKEAFRPQGMIWASLGVTDGLSVEAFYQYDWEPVWVPTPGSYFSSNDFAGYGGYGQNAQLGFNANPDINLDFLISEYQNLAAMVASGQYDAATLGKLALAYPTKATLIQDQASASNSGQYGIKLGYYAPELGETEFGLYYMNYHSRRPLISGTTANFTAEAIGSDLAQLGMIGATGATVDRDTLLGLETFSKAQIVYPEDIQLYGFSFNTLIGDTSVAGEIAHRLDEPLQIDDVELLFAAMPQQLANIDPNLPHYRGDLDGISQVPNYGPGEYAEGFIRLDTTQAQVTFTHLFGPTLGMSNLIMLAEVGGVWIHDMPGFDELRLNGPGTARSGGNPDMPGIIEAVHNGPETNPFPTDFAWGYRLVAKADYNNLFAGVNMSPRIIFSHDVEGITPDPMFLFTEGKKSVAIGVNFDYQSRWGADVSYNSFFGGVGTTNQMADRDYVSFNIKYSI